MRRPLLVAALALLAGCSSSPVEPARPTASVAPIASAAPSAPARPSPCEIAASLVTRAGALRAEARLSRADGALLDALSRCRSMEPQIKPLREAIANERTSADPPEDIAKRAEALAAKGDAAGARRERERWLAAREKRSGNPAWAFAETTSTPFDLAWSPDSKLAAIARGGDLSLYDGDLRKER